MKNIFFPIACFLIAATLFTSCVGKRKYLEARHKANELQSENVAMQQRIQMQQDSMNKLQGNVSALGDVYQATSSELSMSKEQIAAQRARVQQLEQLINQQQQSTEALRKKISDALVAFNSNELTVTMKNGKVYVSMQESLLFPSGSAVVNPKGKEALAKVAGVLNTNPGITVDVEGHTDSIPIHNKMYQDNWALSVARATSIAHVLIDDYSVNPSTITASGKSHYDNVATNETPEGRQLNRRTEIILEPKLDELMQMVNGIENPTAANK